MDIRKLVHNIRFYILLISFVSSLAIAGSIYATIPSGSLRVIRLEQVYGFVSLGFLYLAILATPLTKAFPDIPGRERYLKARRALGVSAFYFGALHSGVAFFGQLGGVNGLSFLSGNYVWSLVLGGLALLILLLMAATSFDYAIKKMTIRWWKFLHRFVYLATLLILGHIFLISTHVRGLDAIATQILLLLLLILLGLEALRIDQQRKGWLTRLGPAMAGLATVAIITVGYIVLSGLQLIPSQIASNPASGNVATQNQSTYTVNISSSNLHATEPNALNVAIFNATTGLPISPFGRAIERYSVSVVNDSLTHYQRASLQRTSSSRELTAQLTFPSNGYYIVYTSFSDEGAQTTLASSLQVGDNPSTSAAASSPQTTAQAAGQTFSAALLPAELGATLRIASSQPKHPLQVRRALLVNTQTYQFSALDGSEFESSTINLPIDQQLSGSYRVFATIATGNIERIIQFTLSI